MKLTRMLAAAATALSLSVPLACASSAASDAGPGSADGAATPTAQRVTDPSDDHVVLPKRCDPNPAQMPTDPIACHLNTFDAGRPTMLLWGDSHAWMYIPALKAAAAGKNVNLVAVVKGTCPPIQFPTTNAPTRLSCYQFNKIGLDLVKKIKKSGQPLRVLLGASWQRYLEALAHPNRQDDYTIQYAKYFKKGTPKLMKTLGAMHVKTDVIGQTGYPCAATNERPKCHLDELPACDLDSDPFACDLPRSEMLPEEASTRSWVKNKMKLLTAGKRYISANDKFCDPVGDVDPMCHGYQNSVYTFYDNDHLSLTFAKSLKGMFAQSVP